jgi:hypothetical protein
MTEVRRKGYCSRDKWHEKRKDKKGKNRDRK